MKKSIIHEAAQGDIKAFKIIFDQYLPKMRPVSLRYSHTSFEADDILQEAFIKIYKNLKDFKFEGSFDGWIRRIVINTALNYRKKNINFYGHESIEEVEEEELEIIEDLCETEPSQLMQLINQLPEGYKMVFNLYVFEDLPHKEIANLLSISEGTSRSQYSKAKKMIRNIISSSRRQLKESSLAS